VIRERFLSFALVLGLGFLLLVSLLVSAALGTLGRFIAPVLPWPVIFWETVNYLISFTVIALLLGMIYKFLPDAAVGWRDVWMGAAVASLLLTTGKALIAVYLSQSSVVSAYGAASSLIVVLTWVYYSAQIVLFGAELTHIYSRQRGSRIGWPSWG
jgi:membrane protein